MGATAALKLRRVAENLEQILALELFCAAQAIDFRKRAIGDDKALGKGTRGVYAAIRKRVPFVDRDQYMKDHMDAVLEIVRQF